VAGTTRVATEGIVVGVDEVLLVLQRDGDGVYDVEEHCAFSLTCAWTLSQCMSYAIMHSENQECLTDLWFSKSPAKHLIHALQALSSRNTLQFPRYKNDLRPKQKSR